jgi:hypothetical protein
VLGGWRWFGRPSGIYITRDDTVYVVDSESGPDTGANELMGIRKGIGIGNARDGKVFAFIEDSESTTPDHSGTGPWGGLAKQRLRRWGPASDVRVASLTLKLNWDLAARSFCFSAPCLWFRRADRTQYRSIRNTHEACARGSKRDWRAAHYQLQGGKPMVANVGRQFNPALGL